MPPSNIQVFVKWKDQTIFAGEDVECTITFRNVADSSSSNNNAESSNNHHLHSHGGQLTPRQPQRKQARAGSSDSSFFSLKSPQNLFFNSSRRSHSLSPQKKPAHRTSSSLSTPLVSSHSFPPPSTPRNAPSSSHKHKRSVSILSIDSEGGAGGGGTAAGGGGGGAGGDKTPASSSPFSRARPPRGHGRSASLQVPPKRNESYDETFMKGRSSVRGFPPESPAYPSPTNLRVDVNHRAGSAAPSPIKPNESSRVSGRRPQLPPIDFKFPAAPPSANETNNLRSVVSPSVVSTEENALQTPAGKRGSKDGTSLPAQSHLPQMTRIISTSSLSGSHRSSGEFYSVSDHSTETLQSEYTNYSTPGVRTIPQRHMRHHSSVDPGPMLANSQTLLMGYAQISASFTVDGSLINQSPFEDVKRKGVVGGQGSATRAPGNGTSRDRGRKGGGFWGVLRWNNIEESLNGLLSNNDLDGLREMRGVSSSRSIPLLSTSQSLLFVDLRLAPGEEQSYSFSFTLPSGLPASHKGKAIKISYNLVIGTQRPSAASEPQRVNRINIPFRVFSGVNGQGQILSHNLMSPYVLLRDEARVRKVGSSPFPTWKQKSLSGPTWTSAPDFLSYVDEILEQSSRGNSLQPPDTPAEKRELHNMSNISLSCKDAIDLAILRSNQAAHSSRSPNRFEIARNGRRIAVVVLNRPAHRLGETIIATVDFADASLPCYALRVTLETSEKVEDSLAVRSNASIHRATRRIHASFFENTLYATRVVFTPAVPISATPTVLTSGVNHEWALRLEFVTPTMHGDADSPPSGAGLLEAVSQDDRGQVVSALENLGCESFEIAIPLTVYGETVRERLPEENEGYSI